MIERLVPFSLLVAALVFGCSNADIPSDSETHFLKGCDEGCGTLQCVCGICTAPCESACVGPVAGAICRASEEPSTLACGPGESPPASYCDLPCDDAGDCAVLGPDRLCVAGYCRPASIAGQRDTSEPDAAPPASTFGFDRDASQSPPPPASDAGEPFPVEIR